MSFAIFLTYSYSVTTSICLMKKVKIEARHFIAVLAIRNIACHAITKGIKHLYL